jgi:hypothetical protein
LYRYSRTEENISGSSSVSVIRLDCDSRNCPRQATWKKGDRHRTSSCAAKIRCSRPTISVIIEEVNVLNTVSQSNDCMDDWSTCFVDSVFSFTAGLRDLSCRVFEIACSRKEECFERLAFLLFEKLSACD